MYMYTCIYAHIYTYIDQIVILLNTLSSELTFEKFHQWEFGGLSKVSTAMENAFSPGRISQKSALFSIDNAKQL